MARLTKRAKDAEKKLSDALEEVVRGKEASEKQVGRTRWDRNGPALERDQRRRSPSV